MQLGEHLSKKRTIRFNLDFSDQYRALTTIRRNQFVIYSDQGLSPQEFAQIGERLLLSIHELDNVKLFKEILKHL